jgi:hypothetical protein
VHRRRRIAVTLALATLTAGVAACDTPRGTPAPIVFRAQAAETEFESALPARLDLALGANVSAFTLSAAAASSGGVWNIRATLTREQVFAGVVSLDVGSSADAAANVQINGATRLQADSGKLDVSFGQGVVNGTVTSAAPEFLNSTFSGALIVECLVPESDGGEALVVDAEFGTAACMPFAVLN